MSPHEIAYQIVHYSSGWGDVYRRIVEAIIAEREACAKIADQMAETHGEPAGEIWIARRIADAIRSKW